MRSIGRWLSTVVGAGLLALGASGTFAQETYPSRPVKIVVPYAPGGAADLFARTVGKHLQDTFGQPFVVDNRPGASQMIGAVAVATAPADGYTLFLGATTSLAVNAYTQKRNIRYDPVKDFAPVSLGMTVPLFLVVNPSFPARDARQLLDVLRAAPGKYTFASIGNGSSTHMAAEMFMQATGTKMVHVPYKSSTPVMADLVAGTVDMNFDVGSTSLPLVHSGKLRVLAVGSTRRFPLLPDLPTVAESIDVPDFEASVWFGVVAPAGTPRPVIDRLSKEINRILRLPEMVEQFMPQGLVLTPNTPEEFGAMIRAEGDKWSKVLSLAGIQPE